MTSSDTFVSYNFFQTLADHHVDLPHETPHLYQPVDFEPSKVKPYDTIFVKTDLLDGFVQHVRRLVHEPYHLITGHSDLSPSEGATEALIRDPKVVSWMAQNAAFETFKLTSLPMGLTEPSRDFGNRDVVRAAFAKFSDPSFVKSDKMLVTNSSPTHPIRAALNSAVTDLADRFSTEMFVAEGGRLEYAEYLDMLGRHKYALVPRGNALDCHRVYECILTRTVPVVVTDSPPAFYNKLPVIVLQPEDGDDLRAVIEKFLLRIRVGKLPPLPTDAEWTHYADLLRVENFSARK